MPESTGYLPEVSYPHSALSVNHTSPIYLFLLAVTETTAKFFRHEIDMRSCNPRNERIHFPRTSTPLPSKVPDHELTRQAHALSAHASDLLQSSNCTPATIHAALTAYHEAAELFERSASEVGHDESAKKTLQLLTTQNRKQARDLERRLNQNIQNTRAQTNYVTPSRPSESRREVPRRNSSPVPSREPSGLGLGAIARHAWPPPGVGESEDPNS